MTHVPRSRLVVSGLTSFVDLVVGLLVLHWTHAIVLALLPLVLAVFGIFGDLLETFS